MTLHELGRRAAALQSRPCVRPSSRRRRPRARLGRLPDLSPTTCRPARSAVLDHRRDDGGMARRRRPMASDLRQDPTDARAANLRPGAAPARPAQPGGRGAADRRRQEPDISRRCSASMAGRWPKAATSPPRSTCCRGPIPRTSRTGASCGARAPCSTRWAATTRRARSTTAPKIVPDEPSILSNLGLSYALSNDLPNADAGAARPMPARAAERVRQNLALVLALEGKFDEAQQRRQPRPDPGRGGAEHRHSAAWWPSPTTGRSSRDWTSPAKAG